MSPSAVLSMQVAVRDTTMTIAVLGTERSTGMVLSLPEQVQLYSGVFVIGS